MTTYKDLGIQQPFAVSDRFSLPMSLAESFKKLTCSGNIEDRDCKSVPRDYKEAIFGIDYAMNHLSEFALHKHSDYCDIAETMDFYNNEFPSVCPRHEFKAAEFILFFAVSWKPEYLTKARDEAVLALNEVENGDK